MSKTRAIFVKNLHIVMCAVIKLKIVKKFIIFTLYVVRNANRSLKTYWISYSIKHCYTPHSNFPLKLWKMIISIMYPWGCLVKMAPNSNTTLHLWHPLIQCYKKATSLSKMKKWHLTKMASNKIAMVPNNNSSTTTTITMVVLLL